MSPSTAAPRMASVAAWQATSASECPSAPFSNGIVDAADDQRPSLDQPVQIVARADAPDGAAVVASARAARSQIRRGRDLHVRRVALDDVDRVAGLLGQRGFVGGLDARRGRARRVRQHVAPECLRRLRQVDRLARDGAVDHRPSAAARRASPCRSPASRRSRRRARPRASIAPRDQLRRHERPRRVVDQHDFGVRGHGVEGVRRPNPAGARRPRRPGRFAHSASHAAARRRISAGSATITLGDRGMRARARRCARESSGRRAPGTASARRRRAGCRCPGRDDRGHVHAVTGRQTIIISPCASRRPRCCARARRAP